MIGGGVSSGFRDLLPGMLAKVRSSAMPPFRDVSLAQSELGDDAGIVGAAALARERLHAVELM